MLEVEDWIGQEPLGPVLNVDEASDPMVASLVLQTIYTQAGSDHSKHIISTSKYNSIIIYAGIFFINSKMFFTPTFFSLFPLSTFLGKETK